MKPIKPLKSFDISLSRQGTVSLNEQLVTQISLQIVNGLLKPGDKLPSVRNMARRLNIHHNTVSSAYGVLAERNLVNVKHGSGVYVSKSNANIGENTDLDGIIRDFLEVARKQGYSLQDIRQSVIKWLDKQPPDHLLIIEPAKDIQKILTFELKQHFDCPIKSATLQQVVANPEILTGALSIATAYHAVEVKKLLPKDALFVDINLQTGREEAQELKRLSQGAIVALISIGETMFEFAPVVIASLRGEDLLVRTEVLDSTKRWQTLANTADLIITDSYCFDKISNFTGKKVLSLSLISSQIVRYLKNALRNSVT